MTFYTIKQLFQNNLQQIYSTNEISAIFKLLAEDCNISYFEHITHQNRELSEKEEQFFTQALNRLQTNEPIQYIRGKADFYGLELEVSSAVLIPRRETELLVHTLIAQLQTLERCTIVDACTGSGCIAIVLAKHLSQAKVYACDISTEALEIAQRNAQKHDITIEFLHCDILQEAACEQLPQCTVLVSNPPYVMQSEKTAMHANVLNFEPNLALFVSNNNPLVFYDALARIGLQKLQSNGIVFCEINEALGAETQQLFENYGYTQVEILRDLHEKHRFVRCVRK
jgi:release factor glutamine methyltransferase